MWHGREKAVLYVADTAASKIFAYGITGTLDFDPADAMKFGTIQAGAQELVVKDLASVSGLALDGFGNLYFTTMDGTVGVLAADKLPANSPTASILYAADGQKSVASPFSLAADNFNVFWANQANGQSEGAVVSAFERNAKELAEKYPEYPKPLAKNIAKAAGVCVAKTNLFFTGEAAALFGVKTTGGGVTQVSNSFKKAKGCVYDGESTLYVADSEAEAVYSLPANFPTLRAVKSVQEVVKCEGAASVAVFTRAPSYVMQSADKGFLGLGW